ncbi:MAG TPA: phosphate acetyltransferase [Gammaproteobacteria bacterium]|nr:phosphate acetyltransferase [Gammaproteobacteria bacterium]
MTQNIYIAGAGQGSGKSVIILAMMELLSGHAGIVGFFRPVIRFDNNRDSLIDLISDRFQLNWPHDMLYGCTVDEASELIANGQYDELLKKIHEQYKALSDQCDLVLCAGTDYSAGHSTLEFDFNADLANNLGCLIVPVVRGTGRSTSQIIHATISFQKSLQERDCDLLATVVNNVEPAQVDALRTEFGKTPKQDAPLYVIPSEPSLAKPTVGDIARSMQTTVLSGDAEHLNRQVYHYKIAAMQVPDFLNHLEEGSLVITPGDRSDIILACLMAYSSTAYPQIAGLLLTGGLDPAPQLKQLVAGLGQPPFALLLTERDTFATATEIAQVNAVLTSDNEHKIAAALGIVEANVDVPELKQRIATTHSTRVTPLMFEYELLHRARSQRCHIVLPEGSEERIMRAAEILVLRDIAKLTLLGDPEVISCKAQALGLNLDKINVIDPLNSEYRRQYAETYYQLRQHKGISPEMAFDTMADVSYFGTMMVHLDHADGMVSGSVNTTQHTIRPAFEIIKTRPGAAIVSSVFMMCLEDRVLAYGDCAVNPDPDAGQLASIAISSADTARMFGIEPRIAMLSYSTGKSGKGGAVEKVREATRIARQLRPDLLIEGPIQYDAAVDASVARTKLPDSEVAGNATIFIFPDLNTGNNTYKAVQRSAGAVAIGPVLQGLNKPVNDLSRGCTVTDIVNTVALTAIQAQGMGQP